MSAIPRASAWGVYTKSPGTSDNWECGNLDEGIFLSDRERVTSNISQAEVSRTHTSPYLRLRCIWCLTWMTLLEPHELGKAFKLPTSTALNFHVVSAHSSNNVTHTWMEQSFTNSFRIFRRLIWNWPTTTFNIMLYSIPILVANDSESGGRGTEPRQGECSPFYFYLLAMVITFAQRPYFQSFVHLWFKPVSWCVHVLTRSSTNFLLLSCNGNNFCTIPFFCAIR